MAEDRTLPYGQPLPATWLAAIQEFIGTASVNFHLGVLNDTTIEVVAGANSGQVGIGIDGLFRYISATISAAVTGAAGVYDIFVVTGPNSFAPNPGGGETDNTNYSFALQALAQGTTPTLTGTVTNFRKVGELDWDGAKITGLRPLVGDFDARQPLTSTAARPSVHAIRAVGIAGQTAALQTWEQPAGTVVGSLSPAGDFSVIGTLSAPTASIGGSAVEVVAHKAQANGYCDLDSNALVPLTRLAGITDVQVAAGNKDGLAGALSLRTLGTGAQQAAAGNDARLSNARTPIAHAPTHEVGGSDEILGIVDAQIDANAAIAESKIAGRLLAAVLGDGSDGAATCDGATAVAGMTRAGSVYTMTRDCYFTNLTINAGATVNRGGFVLHCTGTLTNNGTIQNNGANAVGGNYALGGAGAIFQSIQHSGGYDPSTQVFAGPTPGGTYGGGVGGTGGGGGGGLGAGGAGESPQGGVPRSLATWRGGYVPSGMGNDPNGVMNGIWGGGGGGAGGVDANGIHGGGGGGGGGVIVLFVKTLAGNGVIQANGGNGAASTGGNSSGGGGGGGGLIFVVRQVTSFTGTFSVAGGAGGAGTGTGAAGAAGTAGLIVTVGA